MPATKWPLDESKQVKAVQGSEVKAMVTGEKFSVPELTALRNELVQGGLDARQAGEMLQVFLMGRGYGVSPEAAFDASIRVEGAGCSIESIQKELESLALVM